MSENEIGILHGIVTALLGKYEHKVERAKKESSSASSTSSTNRNSSEIEEKFQFKQEIN